MVDRTGSALVGVCQKEWQRPPEYRRSMANEFFTRRMAGSRSRWEIRKSSRYEGRQLGVVPAGSCEYARAGEVGIGAIFRVVVMPTVRVRLSDGEVRAIDQATENGGRAEFIRLDWSNREEFGSSRLLKNQTRALASCISVHRRPIRLFSILLVGMSQRSPYSCQPLPLGRERRDVC